MSTSLLRKPNAVSDVCLALLWPALDVKSKLLVLPPHLDVLKASYMLLPIVAMRLPALGAMEQTTLKSLALALR